MVANRLFNSDWRLLLKLRPYAQRSTKDLVISLILLVPLAIANAIQPILVQQGIDGPIAKGDLIGLWWLCLLVGFTVLVRLGLQSWQGYLVQKVGQNITADIRKDLFAHVTLLSTSFFDRTPVGRLITRLTSDVEALGDVFATGAVGIFSDLASLGVTAIFMFWLRWDLGLMLTLMIFPITGLIIYFQHEYRKANFKARDKLSDLNAILQENIIGVGIVQLFRRAQLNSSQHYAVNQQYVTEVNNTIFHDSAVSATLEWISLIAIAGVLWLGGGQVIQKQLTFGELSAFVLFSQRLFEPLRQLAEKFTTIQSGFTAIERITAVMNEPIEIRDPVNPKSLPVDGKGEIRFENVWFGYKPDEYVLKNLSFAIAPGEKVALVGPTGAGKSSIIRLLSRLYEPVKGRILIDGIDIKDITQLELRRYLGVILQDVFLFSGNVKDNITLGDDYSLEETIAAAKVMNVDEFIQALPQGYESQVRERGTNLSGGQKQLLAFARAAVRDPRVLILDEATASLDVNTEYLIQKSLQNLLIGRTTIIIAHRLSTIRHVDRILVLKQGEIVESGSHEQLISAEGLYANLYSLEMLALS
ncbi:ABC-type multidrug transport system, ATPase and permease component [Synechococcus sp. PCC 7502]|uniref:ABC transporter ATP-binding protein n=1 Tax=Synechococcus sp. PCC 7502 TaxID=1173263 RepID=UPI00029F9D7A|nr:ABC transporter ATP-binding protein [Synechococcus sp. PCC 7502]AFY74724.1 ABC-type multidrug transport system, ATPase and permease component [Synechococcus sp. PCC 7502]